MEISFFSFRKLTDEQVVAFVRKGGNYAEKALANLYQNARYIKIEYLVLRNGMDKATAQDIFQDAVIAFYQKMRKDPTYVLSCKIDTWLYATAINLLRKRQSSKVQVPFDEQEAEKIADSLAGEDAGEIVESLLTQLESPCREIIEMRYSQNPLLTWQEVSQKLATRQSADALKKMVSHKCLPRLREIAIKLQIDWQNIMS